MFRTVGPRMMPATISHKTIGKPMRPANPPITRARRSEEHTSELQSRLHLVCRLLLEKKKTHHSKVNQERPHLPDTPATATTGEQALPNPHAKSPASPGTWCTAKQPPQTSYQRTREHN